MKKLITAVSALMLFIPVTAQAAVGDISNTLYNTDILTYLDGIPIHSWALDGKMMICVEDLRDHGYTVAYDDSARALFANKPGKPSEGYHPVIERGTTGGIAGYTYTSDIRVFINGMETRAENIGGRMAVVAEDISNTDVNDSNLTASCDPYSGYGYSEYFLRHTYDDSQRALYIETIPDGTLSYERQLSDFLEGKTALPVNGDLSGVPQILARKDTEDCTMLLYKWQWLAGLAKFYRNGIQMHTTPSFFNVYKFQSQMTVTVDGGEFSDDGGICYISGRRYEPAGMHAYELFEEGTYALDTESFVITGPVKR